MPKLEKNSNEIFRVIFKHCLKGCEKMASFRKFFLSYRTANFKNFGISSITSKRKMKWVIKVKVLQSVRRKVLQLFFFSHLFQCLLDGSRMITCSILKMRPLMISTDIRFREVGLRGLLSEVEGKILG